MANYIFSHFEVVNSFAYEEGIKQFINSILRNVPDTKLFFFTNLEDSFNEDNVKFINLNNYKSYYNHNCDRFFFYLNYLLNNTFEKDDNFVFCDCRDVIFLTNIFDKLDNFPNNSVIMGSEDSSKPINVEPFNSDWLAKQNRQNNLKFGNELIINSGIIVIKGFEMAKLFMYQMTLFIKYYVEMLRKKDLIDQGLLNELYYNFLINYKNNFMVLRNEQNCLFNHLAILDRNEFIFDHNVLIQKFTGIKPAIIHQYNRHEDMRNIIYKEYA